MLTGVIKFNRGDLLKCLMSIQSSTSLSKDGCSKFVFFEITDGVCNLFYKSDLYRYRFNLDMSLISGDISKGVCDIVLDLKTLRFLLLKTNGDDILFHVEQDGRIKIYLYNGVVTVENFRRMGVKIKDEVIWKDRGYPKFLGRSSDMMDILSLSQKTCNFSYSQDHKRGCIHDNKFLAWYGSSIVIVKDVFIPDMCFNVFSIPAIKKILSTYSQENEFFITNVNNYHMLDIGNSSFCFPASIPDKIINVASKFFKEVYGNFMEIPFKEFKEIALVCSGLLNDFDSINLESKLGNICLYAKTKTGRQIELPIMKSRSDEFSIKISSEFLKKVVLSLNSKDSENKNIKIMRDSSGTTYFFLGNTEIMVGTSV